MNEYEIVKITEHSELILKAAKWFHQKWNIPFKTYLESMIMSIQNKGKVPQWYIVLMKKKIIAGIGVIENDFHQRKDLTPNVCAVYVEKNFRNQGIAGKLLNFICNDFKNTSYKFLYLLTDHLSFYERYGWEFYCMVENNDSSFSRMYRYKL